MTLQTRKINPLDINPNIGVGVGLDFQNQGVFTTTYTTQQATKNNIINFLLTGQGERYLNPSFGLGLQQSIFEQLTDTTGVNIEQYIQTSIKNLFPTVTIQNLTVTQTPDTNQLNIQMSYSTGPTSTGTTDTLEITIE